jgi:hypothetical protein
MSIAAVEVESVHGGANETRFVFFRYQDHLGEWRNYGPVITNDPAWDAEAYKPLLAAKMEARLAEAEINEALS